MSLFITNGQIIDPRTGIPIPNGLILTCEDGTLLSTQPTGEPPGGLNTLPGTDSNAPGNSDPGLPYGFTEVPTTGPLE